MPLLLCSEIEEMDWRSMAQSLDVMFPSPLCFCSCACFPSPALAPCSYIPAELFMSPPHWAYYVRRMGLVSGDGSGWGNSTGVSLFPATNLKHVVCCMMIPPETQPAAAFWVPLSQDLVKHMVKKFEKPVKGGQSVVMEFQDHGYTLPTCPWAYWWPKISSASRTASAWSA